MTRSAGAPVAAADRARLLRRANALALITIYYNLLEGLVSVGLGLEDETIALFGFGVDSFVEVVSGIGIWHMVRPSWSNSRPNWLKAPQICEPDWACCSE